MTGRRTTTAPTTARRPVGTLPAALLAALLVAAAVLAGCGSDGSGQSAGMKVAAQVKVAVDGYTSKHGAAFSSSAAMTQIIDAAVPSAQVVDANTRPAAARRTDGQVAVLVSGGPMFAFGVYDASAHDGQGACLYASTYGAGVGRWAYGTGTPGVRCGGVRHGASELNTLPWSTHAPEWAQGAARPAPAPGASPSTTNAESGG